MEIVPVLDLKAGRAVHARGGDRAAYAVVRGVLGDGADPTALAAAFRDRLGCRSLYVAHLDAIAGTADACPAVERLAALGPALLVDAGVRTPEAASRLRDAGADRVVVGLETLGDLDELAAIVEAAGAERTVFSLDLRAGRPLAASAALARMDPLDIARAAGDAGVRTLLVLDLARVGAAAGPPLDTLRRLRDRLPDQRLLAGGGVRDVGDLRALAALGCVGALVATALHTGAIGAADVRRLAMAAAPRGSAPPGRSSPPPRP
ncbi:MAG: hisA/hisF family protein [Gemmatimonadetes bacterium]|nr:hisA/hisF family protein [Gemmatimonadota bacterium]